jgi:hypothetical protein
MIASPAESRKQLPRPPSRSMVEAFKGRAPLRSAKDSSQVRSFALQVHCPRKSPQTMLPMCRMLDEVLGFCPAPGLKLHLREFMVLSRTVKDRGKLTIPTLVTQEQIPKSLCRYACDKTAYPISRERVKHLI